MSDRPVYEMVKEAVKRHFTKLAVSYDTSDIKADRKKWLPGTGAAFASSMGNTVGSPAAPAPAPAPAPSPSAKPPGATATAKGNASRTNDFLSSGKL